jgi:predicted SnoaL-like aldol condensation-catalyzing enzyme
MRSPFSRHFSAIAVLATAVAVAACGSTQHHYQGKNMSSNQKQQAVDLLKSIESGDPVPVSYINPDKYIQHNLGAADGLAGFKALLQISKGNAKVNTMRVFEDGDMVFTHTDYDFFGPKIGFDIFRFENGKIVEHWDNLQEKTASPNPSGHTMIDGPTTAVDHAKTQENKEVGRRFVEDILVNGHVDKLAGFYDGDKYIQHHPLIADGVSGLSVGLQAMAAQGITVTHDRIHKVLGEGNFVLVASEGSFAGKATSFYDLFRIEHGKIAEHWSTIETIPPKAEWKNSNGKF